MRPGAQLARWDTAGLLLTPTFPKRAPACAAPALLLSVKPGAAVGRAEAGRASTWTPGKKRYGKWRKKKAVKKTAAPKKKAPPKKKTARRRSTEPGEQQGLFAPDPALTQVLDERLLVPQKTAAAAFGISVEALKKWKVKAHSRRGRETLYYLPDLIKYRMNRVDDQERGLMDARTRLAQAQAEETETRNLVNKGKLIPVDELLEPWGQLVVGTQQRVLGIKTKLKTQCPHLADKDLDKLEQICRDALEELADSGIPNRNR